MLDNITKHIEFSYNWNNKLNCNAFTTLRLSNRFEVGDLVIVYLDKRRLGIAEVKQKFQTTFGKISDLISYIDTGTDADECRKILQTMYKEMVLTSEQRIFLYLFKFVEKVPITAVQGSLFDS